METITELQAALYYYSKGEPKHALSPQKIMNFLRLAHNGELDQIPQGLRELFQLNKNSYPKLCEMEAEAQVEGLKKILISNINLQKEKEDLIKNSKN